MLVSKRVRRTAVLAGLAVLACAVSALVNSTRFFQTLELKTVDLRFRRLGDQKCARPDIILVDIDDPSIKTLEPAVGRWPWPRETHAVFLDFMREAGARLVVFDVLFTEHDQNDPASDQELARATGMAGNVVHAAFLGGQDTGAPDPAVLLRASIAGCAPFRRFGQADLPILPVAERARAIGHVAMALDADGPWRRSFPLACHRGRLMPSLALAAALALQGLKPADLRVRDGEIRAGSLRISFDVQGRVPIWYQGGPGVYRRFPYGQVFYSAIQQQEGQSPTLAPALFKDKIVFVGLTAAALHDVFTTPFSGSAVDRTYETSKGSTLGKITGTEIHAHILDNFLSGRYLLPAPLWSIWLTTLAMAFLVLAAVFRLRLWLAIALLVALPTGYLLLVQRLFALRWQLPVMPVIVGCIAGALLGYVHQYWIEGAEKRKVKEIFSRYVSRDVYNELLNNPSSAALGGKRTVATVLFSDLRGFTTLSEKSAPEAVVAQLNEYFSAMVEIVFARRGTVDKFIGDAIMAIFNAPLPDPEHADQAVRCAIEMNRRLAQLNREWKAQGRLELHCGVGVNTGEMIVGNVGAETIRSYTVIGDNVNLGARLESLCKQHSAEIIISEATRSLLQNDYPMRELGETVVKGKSQAVKIFQVMWEEERSVETP
jgi:adenylate cyclase